MSDSTRKIKITNEPVNEDAGEPAEASRAEEFEYEDEEREREPINLDSSGGLADALAAARRMKVPKPTPSAVEVNGSRETQNGTQTVENGAETVNVADARASDSVVNAELERLRGEAKQANDNYLRALADLQNFRRRGEEERDRLKLYANEKLIKEILPVLDDLDLAVNAAKQSESYEQLIGGVDAILRKFRETLAKQGVEPIDAVGQKFDPDVHEAVMVDEGSDEPDETVTAELRKGYTLHKRVIRPAMVKVAKQ